MRTHLLYSEDGQRVMGLSSNVYLARLSGTIENVHYLGKVLYCTQRFRRHGPTFADWLGEQIHWELCRVDTCTEPEPLVLPTTWETIDYTHACAVLIFVMRVLGPQPWLLQLSYAVAQAITMRPRDPDAVTVLE